MIFFFYYEKNNLRRFFMVYIFWNGGSPEYHYDFIPNENREVLVYEVAF
jgi:hypothetical protein